MVAMNTAGRAVLFAGTTVVIALLGMFALGVELPQRRRDRRVARRAARCSPRRSRCCPRCSSFGRRRAPVGATRASRAPRPSADRRLGLLGAVGRRHPAPARRRRDRRDGADARCSRRRRSACGSGPATPATTPPDTTTRQAYDLLAAGLRPGLQRPAAARRGAPPQPARRTGADAADRAVAARPPGVAAVAPAAAEPGPRRRGDRRLPARRSPQSAQTTSLVKRLRDRRDPADREGDRRDRATSAARPRRRSTSPTSSRASCRCSSASSSRSRRCCCWSSSARC